MIPKRALSALLTTVFALALLLNFKTATDLPVNGTTSGGSVAVGDPPNTSGATSGSAAATPPAASNGSASAAGPAPTSAPSGAYKDGTATGSVVSTEYGDVQVQVTISGGAVTDVTALQLPDRDRRSQRIASSAEPVLREEALTAQSANIDLLSGATYTSEAYAESLQSALDQVRA